MEPSSIGVLITAVSGALLGGAGLVRSRRSDQRDEIADLWTENRQLRGELRELRTEVAGLRREVESCQSEKSDLARQLAAMRGGP